jgi:hypothetical protein
MLSKSDDLKLTEPDPLDPTKTKLTPIGALVRRYNIVLGLLAGGLVLATIGWSVSAARARRQPAVVAQI